MMELNDIEKQLERCEAKLVQFVLTENEEVKILNALLEAEKCGATILFDENQRLKAELEKSQCMLAGFMVAEDQEKARLKERVAKLEKVREAAQETYQVLCIEYGYRKAEVNFGYLSKALKNCEASDEKQD